MIAAVRFLYGKFTGIVLDLLIPGIWRNVGNIIPMINTDTYLAGLAGCWFSFALYSNGKSYPQAPS
jgi:hypothetical protein